MICKLFFCLVKRGLELLRFSGTLNITLNRKTHLLTSSLSQPPCVYNITLLQTILTQTFREMFLNKDWKLLEAKWWWGQPWCHSLTLFLPIIFRFQIQFGLICEDYDDEQNKTNLMLTSVSVCKNMSSVQHAFGFVLYRHILLHLFVQVLKR